MKIAGRFPGSFVLCARRGYLAAKVGDCLKELDESSCRRNIGVGGKLLSEVL
jgi:hypothetical protein